MVWKLSKFGNVLVEDETRQKVMIWGLMYGHITFFRGHHRLEPGVKVYEVNQ